MICKYIYNYDVFQFKASSDQLPSAAVFPESAGARWPRSEDGTFRIPFVLSERLGWTKNFKQKHVKFYCQRTMATWWANFSGRCSCCRRRVAWNLWRKKWMERRRRRTLSTFSKETGNRIIFKNILY
jgi:hypothetical protein